MEVPVDFGEARVAQPRLDGVKRLIAKVLGEERELESTVARYISAQHQLAEVLGDDTRRNSTEFNDCLEQISDLRSQMSPAEVATYLSTVQPQVRERNIEARSNLRYTLPDTLVG